MRVFSKSKLLALRQCPKRLWLEVHRPQLRANSDAAERSFQIGHSVGDIAHTIYDPQGNGELIDVSKLGFAGAFERSKELLQKPQPVFEAGFSAGGALAFADVMLPSVEGGAQSWRMIEVKSSTSVKNYHHDDVAVQAYVAKSAGVNLQAIALAHIDSSWVYPGNQDYRGLLKENDLSAEAFARSTEVKEWIAQACGVVEQIEEPTIAIGAHCDVPFECGFHIYCSRNEPKPEYPVYWLPRISSARVQELAKEGVDDLRDILDEHLNERQQRVKTHTLAGTVYFDAVGAAKDLAPFSLPIQFLDFETIQFPVPIWAGTRPYQQIPFQFSLHTLIADGSLQHREFLDLTGQDPSLYFAQALIAACGNQLWPIFAYNASFEKARIFNLAERFPTLQDDLLSINERIQDLLPIARERYYHPSQRGSWSIKAVLPALVPDLRYSDLEGVQDGAMAMDAFLEAINPGTPGARKESINSQLLAYCKLDTFAMVKLWQVFSGRTELKL